MEQQGKSQLQVSADFREKRFEPFFRSRFTMYLQLDFFAHSCFFISSTFRCCDLENKVPEISTRRAAVGSKNLVVRRDAKGG